MRKLISIILVALWLPWMAVAPGLAQSDQPQKLLAAQGQRKEQTVYFNTKTLKFHHPSCRWAKRCTRNCILIPRSEAIRRGGVPCKVCGGG